MNMSRTRRTAVALAAVLGLILAACGGDADSGGEGEGATSDGGTAAALDSETSASLAFAFWGDDDRASRYQESIDLFEEAYPNITVDARFQAWDDYWTARNTEAAGSSLPDVIQMDLSFLRQYANNGQLADLSGQVDSNLDLSGFNEGLVDSGRLEDALYGVPTSTNTLATFVNASLVEETGVEPLPEGFTWDDYFAWATEVSAAGADMDPQIYGGDPVHGVFWFFMQYLLQQGITPFTDDGQLNFGEEEVLAWLELSAEARANGAFYPPDKATQAAPLTGFGVAEAATQFTWDNFLAGHVSQLGEDTDIQILPVPALEGDGSDQFWKPSMLLSVSENSQNKEAAAAFIDFLVNEPEVGEIFGTSKGVPAIADQRDAMAVEEGSVDATVIGYEDAVEDQVTQPAPLPVEGFGPIEAEWLRLGEELSYGAVDEQGFADQWFAFVDQTLE